MCSFSGATSSTLLSCTAGGVLEGLDIRMRKRAFRLQVSCRRGEDSVDKDRRDFLEVGVIREQNFFLMLDLSIDLV